MYDNKVTIENHYYKSILLLMPNTVEHLYKNHHQWLYRWLCKKMQSRQQAEDIAQDTFLRLLNKKTPIIANEPRALLMTIAQGIVSNFYRHQNIEQSYLNFLATLPEQHHPDPETQAILFETIIQLDQRLAGLDHTVRQTFLLIQLDGLTQAQAAQQLNISVPTVQRYIAKALHQCCFAEFN